MKKVFEAIDEKEVQYVKDHEMQDGAIYSGQMKKVLEDGIEILIKHGRGE